ncbi:unnamed protein product, partial [Musa acuminata var. zebrina]
VLYLLLCVPLYYSLVQLLNPHNSPSRMVTRCHGRTHSHLSYIRRYYGSSRFFL